MLLHSENNINIKDGNSWSVIFCAHDIIDAQLGLITGCRLYYFQFTTTPKVLHLQQLTTKPNLP